MTDSDVSRYKANLPKKKSLAQSIDDDGLDVLRNALPKNNSGIRMQFIEQGRDDYGIDGEFQVFQDGEYVNKVYKVQLKSIQSLKSVRLISNGQRISYRIDVRSMKQYLDGVNVPLTIILATVKEREIYWCPAQTDETMRQDLAEHLQKRQDKMTIHFDVANELTKDKYQNLLDYLDEAEGVLAKRRHFEDVQKLSIIERLDEYEDVVKIPGIGIETRTLADSQPANAIMTIISGDTSIDFVPNKDYKSENAIKAEFNFKFKSNKSDQQRSTDLQALFIKGCGEVELNAENIAGIITTSGDTTIENMKNVGPIKITATPPRYPILLILDNGAQELEINATAGVSNEKLFIESDVHEALKLHIESVMRSSGMPPDSAGAPASMSINRDNITSLQDELPILDFLQNSYCLTIAMRDKRGFKSKLYEITDGKVAAYFSNRYKATEMLIAIEEKLNIEIAYPIPEDLPLGVIEEVRLIQEAITTGVMEIGEYSFLWPVSEHLPTLGQVFAVDGSLHFAIFGKEYVPESWHTRYTGTICQIENQGEKYEISANDAKLLVGRVSR